VAAGLRPIRVTVPDGISQVMSKAVADRIFTARDDLSFALPTSRDEPANLLFDDTLAGVPLRRQSLGEYSWLITISPRYAQEVKYEPRQYLATGRDPRLEHNVSIVVFHKRNLLFPIGGETELNEREVSAEVLSSGPDGGEVRLVTTVPSELNGMRQGEWIMLHGRYPHGKRQRFFLGWYRIVSMDLGYDEAPESVTQGTRIVSLKGPQWPWPPGGDIRPRAGLISGAIAVHTKTMRLESMSPWSIRDLSDIGAPVAQ
jgi:hypothetical protein